jgi:hypothetical protein
MRANVYALYEARVDPERPSAELYMVGGTYQEMLDHYTRSKGRPPATIEQEINIIGGEPHSIWFLDRDETGSAAISQYKVGIKETFD